MDVFILGKGSPELGSGSRHMNQLWIKFGEKFPSQKRGTHDLNTMI
jgi:hypothetical protein